MNTKHKLLILLVIANTLCGCATHALLSKTEKTVGTPTVSLDKFNEGVISDNKIAKLCFKNTGHNYLDGDIFTVEIDLKQYFEYFNNKIITKERNDYFIYKSVHIKSNNLYGGCKEMSTGTQIVAYENEFTQNSDGWRNLNSNYKNTSLFIPAQNNQGAVLYLSINNVSHMALGIQQEYIYTKQSACFICYAGVPFTIVFDIITSPIQLALWLSIDH